MTLEMPVGYESTTDVEKRVHEFMGWTNLVWAPRSSCFYGTNPEGMPENEAPRYLLGTTRIYDWIAFDRKISEDWKLSCQYSNELMRILKLGEPGSRMTSFELGSPVKLGWDDLEKFRSAELLARLIALVRALDIRATEETKVSKPLHRGPADGEYQGPTNIYGEPI